MNGPALSRRSFLRSVGIAAVAVRVVGGAPPVAAAENAPTTITGSGAHTDVGDVFGPPLGSRTNVLRSTVETAEGRRTTWRGGGGRRLVLTVDDGDLDVCYHDPALAAHTCSEVTTTVGELEQTLRTTFGDHIVLELAAALGLHAAT